MSSTAFVPDVAFAVATFRKYPDLNDEEIYRRLVKHGIARPVAARLVEFLPSAYCRIILEDSGARFPGTFHRRRKDGTISPAIDLKSEPIYEAALIFARREIQDGLSRDDKLRLASRSAHFHAANSPLQQGSKLENIAFTPAIHPWDDEGPPVDNTAEKPLWRQWLPQI